MIEKNVSAENSDKKEVKLIDNLGWSNLTLQKIADYPDDARPIEMINNFLINKKNIVFSHDVTEKDRKSAQRFQPLFFLLDADYAYERNWLMKAKNVIDSGEVKFDKKTKLMSQLVAVKAYFKEKYAKKSA